jgi:hypothetical protein
MRGLYKIGHTKNSPHQRALDLSRATGVPEEFYVVGHIEIERPDYWERRFHEYLSEFRSNNRREFFKCRLADIGPLFLMNAHACAVHDCDFSPGMYQEGFKVEDLPNPYHQDGRLKQPPVRKPTLAAVGSAN